MIPQARYIHRFWAGKAMPEIYSRFADIWLDLNPGWRIIDWDEASTVDLGLFPDLQPVIDDLYRRDGGRRGIELFVQLADVIGYALVREYGGVYVNCDIQPVQPLPELPDKAWASYENNEDGRIVNAAIGARGPRDPFWESLLEALPGRYFANPTAEMVETTGPALLTDHARAHPDQIHVYPVETFNPVHWKQIQPGGDASWWADGINWIGTPTIGVHHWGHKKDGRTNVVEAATS